MKLESIGISNFKAFGQDIQRLPLKPITLVFGPNSAGKSSALHSLLWLHHVLTTGSVDVRFPRCANGLIDLGGFAQTLHRHDPTRRVVVELTFSKSELPETIRGFWQIEKKVSLDLSFGRVIGSASSSFDLVDYRLKIDGSDFLTAIRKPAGLSISTLALDHQAVADRISLLSSRNVERHRAPIQLADLEGMSTEEAADKIAELHREVEKINTDLEQLGNRIAQEYILECRDLLPSGIRYQGEPKDDELWDMILPNRLNELIRTLSEGASEGIAKLRYVPPLRELPPRYFDLNGSDVVWQRLFDDESVGKRVNTWLSKPDFKTKYELKIAEYFSSNALERELPSFLRNEIGKFLTSKMDCRYEYDSGDIGSSLGECILGLLEKYDYETIKKFLRTQLDLLADTVQREYEFARYDEVYWQEMYSHPSGKTIEELGATEAKDYIGGAQLNWEAWVGQDALRDSEDLAVELFQRWAVEQPILLELIDQRADPFASSERFLKSSTFSGRDIRREIILQDKNSKTEVSLQDVGVGISQVLPVILNAFGESNKLIAIEQPEIHIHPALQAELGDVFIESALGENKNTLLLETHSEHLILRILKRIRETTRAKLPEGCLSITPADIAVLYVAPSDEGSLVRELRINDQGRFIDNWPNGFFEERFNEEF